MKIGFLHSVKLHLGNIANAKLSRVMYEDWKVNPRGWFYSHFYGQHTSRDELRGLIYNYRTYSRELQDLDEYDLIALSLNFDTYHSDFHKFVTDVINKLYYYMPILHQKEVIIMAGNETFEKRRSAEKVFETCFDTKKGIEKSVKPNLPVCGWNQKIYTSGEKKAFNKLLNSELMKSVCKYIGYQSLGTHPTVLHDIIYTIKDKGFEPIDVEMGTKFDNFQIMLSLFNINKFSGVDKIFLLTPYISKELANYNKIFKNYALCINGRQKEKFEIIRHIQQYKDKKEEVLNKMFDDIVLGIIYKYGTRGWGVKRIQKIFNIWIEEWHDNYQGIAQIEEDGLFGSNTKKAITDYQKHMMLTIDGIAGSETLTSMFNFMLNRFNK